MPFVHENVKVELFPGTPSPIVYLSENDVGDTVVFELVYKGQPVNIPNGSVVKFNGTKKDGLGFTVNSSNVSGNVIEFIVSEDMTSCSGVVKAEISITLSNNKHGTGNVVLIVEKNPHPDGVQDGSYPQIVSEIRELVNQAEGDAETASNAAEIAVDAKNTSLQIQQDVHQYTAASINDWLNNHPEATTTVQDGSLTESKFADSLKLKAIKDYVTPEMFGAVGGADDTEAFKDALAAAASTGKPVLLSGVYRISGPIQILDSDIKIYGTKRYRASTGAYLVFSNIPDNGTCITIGYENNNVSDRIRAVEFKDIRILNNNSNSKCTTVLSIGDISGLYCENVAFVNNNLRSSDYTDAQLGDPVSESNYAIKFNGDAEILTFRNCSASADIPIYSILPPDFLYFDGFVSDAGAYGYAHYYGASLCGNTTLVNISMNRGLYGFKFVSDTLARLSGVLNVESFRIEQLRRRLVDGVNISTNISIMFTITVIPRNVRFASGRIDGNGSCIELSGSPGLQSGAIVTLENVTGIRQTYDQPFLVKVDEITTSNLILEFINCSLENGGAIIIPDNYGVYGIGAPSAGNSSLRCLIKDGKISALLEANDFTTTYFRTKAVNENEYCYKFKNTLTAGQNKGTFISRLINPFTGNKVIAFDIEFTIIGANIFDKCTVHGRYATSEGVIDATSVILTTVGDGREDIIDVADSLASANTKTGKAVFYPYGKSGAYTIFGFTNKTSDAITVYGDVHMYTVSSLI